MSACPGGLTLYKMASSLVVSWKRGKLIWWFHGLQNSCLVLVHSLFKVWFLQWQHSEVEDLLNCQEASVSSPVLTPLLTPNWLAASSLLLPSPSRSWVESYWARSGDSGLSSNRAGHCPNAGLMGRMSLSCSCMKKWLVWCVILCPLGDATGMLWQDHCTGDEVIALKWAMCCLVLSYVNSQASCISYWASLIVCWRGTMSTVQLVHGCTPISWWAYLKDSSKDIPCPCEQLPQKMRHSARLRRASDTLIPSVDWKKSFNRSLTQA